MEDEAFVFSIGTEYISAVKYYIVLNKSEIEPLKIYKDNNYLIIKGMLKTGKNFWEINGAIKNNNQNINEVYDKIKTNFMLSVKEYEAKKRSEQFFAIIILSVILLLTLTHIN